MNINTATQTFTATTVTTALAAGTEVKLHDDTYGVTITPTETGYTVTDTTGGDQAAATITGALAIAVDFITEVDEAGDWADVVTVLS